MSKLQFPEIPKDYVPPKPGPLIRYWVNDEGMLTVKEEENVLVTQVGSPIALYKAEPVDQAMTEALELARMAQECIEIQNMHSWDEYDTVEEAIADGAWCKMAIDARQAAQRFTKEYGK